MFVESSVLSGFARVRGRALQGRGGFKWFDAASCEAWEVATSADSSRHPTFGLVNSTRSEHHP